MNIVNSIIYVPVQRPENGLTAAVSPAITLKWQTFSGAIRTAIRCLLLPVLIGKSVIMQDVSVAGREKVYRDL